MNEFISIKTANRLRKYKEQEQNIKNTINYINDLKYNLYDMKCKKSIEEEMYWRIIKYLDDIKMKLNGANERNK